MDMLWHRVKSALQQDTRKSRLLMGALILILMGIGLWGGSFLIMGIALALLIFMASFEDSLKSGLRYIVNGVILLFLLLLLLALLLDLEWKPRAAQLQTYGLPEDGSPLVELSLPRLILMGSDPVSGSVHLREGMVSPGSITMTLVLPSALQFADMPDSSTRSIRLSSQGPHRVHFPLQGLAVVPGLWGDVKIEAQLEDASGRQVRRALPLHIEGWMTAALRRALDGWRGESSSLVGLAISALAGLGGLALQMFQERMKREARIRSEGERLIADFRTYLEEGDIHAARGTFDRILTMEQKGYISEGVLQRMEDVLRALESPEPPSDLETILQQAASWPEAGARLFLKFAPVLPDPMRRMLRQWISTDRLPERLRNEIDALPAPLPSQPQRWPPEDLIPSAPPAPAQLPAFIQRRLNGRDPFPAARAEEEVRHLQDPRLSVFWPHPLWAWLIQARQPACVKGPPGSGRTAMAAAMTYQLHPGLQHDLILYLPAWMGPDAVPRGFARLLLRFIQEHPTWLAPLDRSTHQLMSRFLKAAIGPEAVQAAIHQALYRLEEASWLHEAKDQQREIWLKEARYGLRRMLQEGASLQVSTLSEMWTEELRACAQALDFQQVRVIMDLSGPLPSEPSIQELEIFLFRWAMAGISSVVFLPAGEFRTAMVCREIQWEAGTLRAMMEHRYRMILGKHRSISEIIEPKALDKLIELSLLDPEEGAPRRLGRLWRQIVGNLPNSRERVLIEDINL